MIAFRAEYESGEISLQEDEIADAQFFKFDQLPEIPFKGSIARNDYADYSSEVICALELMF